MSNTILDMRGVGKSYMNGPENLQILQALDFSMQGGQSSIILGESGSGKSTFLNLIGGLDKPDEGTISVNGITIDGMTEVV